VTAFSHINAVNMQRSELACYNYRRRWKYVTLILSSRICPWIRQTWLHTVSHCLHIFIATVFCWWRQAGKLLSQTFVRPSTGYACIKNVTVFSFLVSSFSSVQIW